MSKIELSVFAELSKVVVEISEFRFESRFIVDLGHPYSKFYDK